jgi:hypothetical protein
MGIKKKKMSKKVIIIVASIGLMIIFACTQRKAKPANEEVPTEHLNLLLNAISDGEETVSILYDTAYKIQELLVSHIKKYSFFYNNQGDIIRITEYDSIAEVESDYNFSYNRDTVAVKLLCPAFGLEADYIYIINDKGYVQKESTRNNHGNRSEAVFEYDKIGNLLKINLTKQIDMFLLPSRTNVINFDYEYDNAHGICKNINAPQWLYIFLNGIFDNSSFFMSVQNNVRKMTINENNSISSISYTYTYKNNYPETMQSNGTNVNFHYISKE